MAPIIRTEKLRKVYAVGKERVVALNDVDIAIEKGEFCCIVGQSGSGKSTLLNQLAGLEKPTRGKVFIGQHEISGMDETQLAHFRQAHLGFIFQSYNLLPSMTAAENVALPLMFKGVPRSQRIKLARRELKDMGLGARADHMPTERASPLSWSPMNPRWPPAPTASSPSWTARSRAMWSRTRPPGNRTAVISLNPCTAT